jgi:hypothetical protein
MFNHSAFVFHTILLVLIVGNNVSRAKRDLNDEDDDGKCPQFSPQCTCDFDTITCFNFTSFSELNLSNYNATKIFLKPLSLATLDKNFNLDDLVYQNPNDISIDLINVRGFDLNSNLFKKQSVQDVQLSFQDSNFEVYIDGVPLGPDACNWNLVDQSYRSILANVSRLVLDNVNYQKMMCPIIFKNANIDVLYTDVVTNENHFTFSNLPEGQNLNTNINSFFILKGDFYIDSTFFNEKIFKNLNQLIITDSTVYGIEEKLFSPLKNVRKIALGLHNMGDFFRNGTKWLNSINDDLFVDLNNQTDILMNQDRQVFCFSFNAMI